MSQHAAPALALRAEAITLAVAGAILLGLGFPTTLTLAIIAFSTGAQPLLPLVIGAPPIVAGYLACHFASARLVKAKALGPCR